MTPLPSVRIVIPAFQATATIKSCVQAIYLSRLSVPFEVVVVDDGANPGLEDLLYEFPVMIVRTGGSGSAAFARNAGCSGFAHGIIVFVDADVLVEPAAIGILIAPLIDRTAEATVGNYSKDVDGLSIASKYKQLYISRIYDRRVGYLYNDFWTAIGAIDAALFHRLGGFDTSFSGACGEDGELGVRLTAAGERVLGVPAARGRHRAILDLKKLLLNDWRKGRVALLNHAQSDGRLSDNKHATHRDILSVILAVSIIVALLASPVFSGFPLLIMLAVYLLARSDVMARFVPKGAWFAVQAFGIMMLLDIVRCACVLSWCFELRLPAALLAVTERRLKDHA